MTLCINYKAQLAVTNFGPRHTTHLALIGWVKGPIKTPLSTQLAMLTEIFLGVILGLYDPLWHVEWPTKVHEGSGGVLDGLSAVGGALRGPQRPFSR
jgi:hypothetical protein